MTGGCCLHVVDLTWVTTDHPLALFQEALLAPTKNLHVWGCLSGAMLTILLAAYVGYAYEGEHHRRLAGLSGDAGSYCLRVVYAAWWIVSVVGWLIGRLVSKCIGARTMHRLRAAIVAAAWTAFESIAFWLDLLWLYQSWHSYDPRELPSTIAATSAYALGCAAYAFVSLRLVLPLSYKNERLDVDIIMGHADAVVAWRCGNVALWALVIVASWGASPKLLTLLPWTSRKYAGLPSLGALDAVFSIKTCLTLALIVIKSSIILRLNASNDLVFFTLLLNLFLFATALVQRILTWSAVHAQKTRFKKIVVFLSYRVRSDQDLVLQLYDKLVALGLRVWLDKECLRPGQQWQDGFCEGLFSSRVFVPVLSKAGLANFSTLTANSECDNVMLEHLLALELAARGVMRAVYPVLVGEANAGTSQYSNFFQSGGLPSCPEDVVAVNAVDQRALQYLHRHHRAATQLRLLNRSPKGVLEQLCRYQGGFVEGDRNRALDEIARTIHEMVMDVADGRVIAEARELVDGRARPRERQRERRSLHTTSAGRGAGGGGGGSPSVPHVARSMLHTHTMRSRTARRVSASQRPAPEAKRGCGVEAFFAPPGLQIPDESGEMVVSAVKRHAVREHQVHGALRRLAPAVKALSPRSQNKQFLAVIDKLENVVGTTVEQRTLVESEDVAYDQRRDRKTCQTLRSTAAQRKKRVDDAIAHRHAQKHGAQAGPKERSVVTVEPSVVADWI